jgi:transcriptional regulator with XRE-family HTH domain
LKSLYVQRQERLRSVLKEGRLAAGVTQQELCRRMKRNRMFVSAVEAGSRSLNVVEFIEYAEALGLDPRKLLGRVI